MSNRTSERKALIVFGERPLSARKASHELMAEVRVVCGVKWEVNRLSGITAPVLLSYSLAKKGRDVNTLGASYSDKMEYLSPNTIENSFFDLLLLPGIAFVSIHVRIHRRISSQ